VERSLKKKTASNLPMELNFEKKRYPKVFGKLKWSGRGISILLRISGDVHLLEGNALNSYLIFFCLTIKIKVQIWA
jgi:hypothetical protein